MKICNLKIETEFYDLITSGEKKYEVRRLKKNYIYKNDIIHFIDLDKKHLGYALVKRVYVKPLLKVLDVLDSSSKVFIKTYYKDEKMLFMFKIKPLKEIWNE